MADYGPGGGQAPTDFADGGSRDDRAAGAQVVSEWSGGTRDDSGGGCHALTISPDRVRVSPRSRCVVPVASRTMVVP